MDPPYPPKKRRPILMTLILIELFLVPAGILLLEVVLARNFLSSQWPPPLALTAVGLFFSGGFLAWQYDRLKFSNLPREHQHNRALLFIASWVLFTGVEFVLGFIYFCGGCMYMMSQLDLSNMH